MRKHFSVPGWRRAGTGQGKLFAVDGGDGAGPAGEGFEEGELDGGDEVVVGTGEERVGFLFCVRDLNLGGPGRGSTSVMMKCMSCVLPSLSWSPTLLNLIFVPAL